MKKNKIKTKSIKPNYDFYIVEIPVDGFGNDTKVETIWPTKEEAEEHAEKFYSKSTHGWYDNPYKIVGGRFGERIKLKYNGD